MRWLSAQRRPASLSIADRVRATPCPAYPVRDPPPPLAATVAAATATLLSGRKSDKCAELSACQICSPLFPPLLSFHAARESSVRERPSRFVASRPPLLPAPRGQNSLSVEFAVVQYFLFFFFFAVYISHAWESSRRGESLIKRSRSLLREKRSTSLASLAKCVLSSSRLDRTWR